MAETLVNSFMYFNPSDIISSWQALSPTSSSYQNPIDTKSPIWFTTNSAGLYTNFTFYGCKNLKLNSNYDELGSKAYVLKVVMRLGDTTYITKSYSKASDSEFSLNDTKLNIVDETGIELGSITTYTLPYDLTKTYATWQVDVYFTYDSGYTSLSIVHQDTPIYKTTFNVKLGANITNPYTPVN